MPKPPRLARIARCPFCGDPTITPTCNYRPSEDKPGFILAGLPSNAWDAFFYHDDPADYADSSSRAYRLWEDHSDHLGNRTT